MNSYLKGVGIAVCAMSISFFAGMLAKKMLTPRPCVANLSTTSYPMFVWEQAMLEESWEYDKESDFYRSGIKTSVDLAYKLVEISQDSSHPSSIYINTKTGSKFYVPGLCRVGSVDWFGDPILVRK